MQYRLSPIISFLAPFAAPFLVFSTAFQASYADITGLQMKNPMKGISVEVPVNDLNRMLTSYVNFKSSAPASPSLKMNLTAGSTVDIEVFQFDKQNLIVQMDLSTSEPGSKTVAEPIDYNRQLETLAGRQATLVYKPGTSTLTASVGKMEIHFKNLIDQEGGGQESIYNTVAKIFSENAVYVISNVLNALELLPLTSDQAISLPEGTLLPTEIKNTFVFELNDTFLNLRLLAMDSFVPSENTQCFNLGSRFNLMVKLLGHNTSFSKGVFVGAILSDPYLGDEVMDGHRSRGGKGRKKTTYRSGNNLLNFTVTNSNRPVFMNGSGADGDPPEDRPIDIDRTPEDMPIWWDRDRRVQNRLKKRQAIIKKLLWFQNCRGVPHRRLKSPPQKKPKIKPPIVTTLTGINQ